MPSPIGHGLAGLAVHLASAENRASARNRTRAALLVAAALAADLDLLFRFVDGRNHHNGWTHSVGAAVVAGLAALLWNRRRMSRPGALATAVGGAWATHVLLDYLNRDANPPIGVMALWPLSGGYYKVPWPVLFDVSRAFDWASLLHNTIAVAWEVTLLLPLVMWVARRRFGGLRTLIRHQ